MSDLATKLWPHVIQEIDNLARSGEEAVRSVPTGTSLATDDERTRPFQTSHALQQCLVAGIDNLGGLRHMIFGAPGETAASVTVHQSAHYLLARGAIENFLPAFGFLDRDRARSGCLEP